MDQAGAVAADASPDGKVHGLRSCAPGDTLFERDRDATFAWEQFGFYQAIAPLVSAFARLMRETQALQPTTILVDDTPQHIYEAQLRERVSANGGRLEFRAAFPPPRGHVSPSIGSASPPRSRAPSAQSRTSRCSGTRSCRLIAAITTSSSSLPAR